MKTDIQIARECKLDHISEIASRLGIPTEEIEPYGRYMAKVPISSGAIPNCAAMSPIGFSSHSRAICMSVFITDNVSLSLSNKKTSDVANVTPPAFS